jgi:large subunit ribosomal protein L33
VVERVDLQRPTEDIVAKKKNVARKVIHLECTEQRGLGVPGVSRYTTQKNKKNTPGRLELRKYNPFLRRYTVHREVK